MNQDIKKLVFVLSAMGNIMAAGWFGWHRYQAYEERRIQLAIEAGFQEGLRNGHVAMQTGEGPGDEHRRRMKRARTLLDALRNPVIPAASVKLQAPHKSPVIKQTANPPSPPGMKTNVIIFVK